MVRRGAAADDSELWESRVPAAGSDLNTKLSQDPEFNETITGVIVVMVAYKSQLDVKKRGFAWGRKIKSLLPIFMIYARI